MPTIVATHDDGHDDLDHYRHFERGADNVVAQNDRR
jgi:hypothetical protein